MPQENSKQIAVVTGAAGNLGQAVAKKFIDKGWFVIGATDPAQNDKLDLPALSFEQIAVDILDEEASKKFIESIISKYNRIDAAILTVGGFAMGKITDTTTNEILKQYKLNFETAYNIARPVFMQMMKQNNGRIFLIGSKPGLSAGNSNGMVAYSLGKSLIFRLAELMNDEAKGHNLVTNVLVPSTIDTPQNRKSMPDADYNKWVRPEDIASIIHYHCTDEATILRETVIKVYGNS
jgi:NAD(P)-dependent dehydrogenase (short-subunit alcohol dehydrogenase family)